MSYTTTSQLEREALSKGDPLIWQQFFRSYVDSDANVRNKCYTILNENPEGAKQAALEKLVEKGGVWLELDDRLDGYLHVHGLRDQTRADPPYTLSLAQKYFEHPEHDRIRPVTQEHLFTQPTLARLLYNATLAQINPAGILQPPTTKQLDALSRALVISRAHNKQPGLTSYAVNMLSTDIHSDINTSTRAHYTEETKLLEIVHGFGDLGERIILNNGELDDGPICQVPTDIVSSVARAALGTTEDATTVDARYQTLLGLTAPSWFLIPPPCDHECAVHMWVAGEHRDTFFIDLYRLYRPSPTRLVKTKSIASEENAQ